jgi:hypothetical protein
MGQGARCLPYHQYREQWVTNSWNWYASHESPKLMNKKLSLEEAQALIQERRTEITPDITNEVPSQSAILFSMFAEILDEDGALSDLEDMGWTLGGFDEEDLDQME